MFIFKSQGYVEGAGHLNPGPYRDEFIKYYQDEMSVVPFLPWLRKEASRINDIYVKLKLQEKQYRAGRVVQRAINSHEDMFKLEYKDGKPVRFILLSGIAGSGKTTIVSKIATDWAEQKPGSQLSKFTFLVALSMRELKSVRDLTEAIYDQILAEDTKLNRWSLKYYLRSHPDEVLIVLDGADEYDEKGSNLPSEGNIIKIITNDVLRGCTVIVTTRPYMVDKLCELNPSFVHIETRGFSDGGVQEYIQKFFKGEDSKVSVGLFVYLKASETLLSLARTPIMLLLMCLVWSDEQKLPEILTELFEEALLYIFKRYCKKFGFPIPDDKEILEKKLMDLYKTLGKVALDGLMLPGQKLVFEAGDFGKSEAVDKACKIGLLSKEKIRSKLRAVERVTFFHTTFQEAIAGFYWASLVESDNELFESYLSKVVKSNALGMEYLMRFCCGGNVRAARSLLHHVADTFSSKTESSDRVNSDEPFRRLWKVVRLLGNAFPECLTDQLKRLENLRVLKLDIRDGLCSEYLNTFAKVLPSLNLPVLEVSISERSPVKPEAFLSVVRWACASPSMNELKFHGCICLPHSNVEPHTMDALQTLQPTKNSIRKLNVSGTSLGPYMTVLLRLIEQMPFLRRLYMEDMSFEGTDWTDLAGVLQGCQLLEELNLSQNAVGCMGLQATFQGTGYYVHSVPVAWAQAKEFCQKMGGNLLMPKSSEENAFANSLLQEHGASTAWFDCSDRMEEGKWLCSDETPYRDIPYHNEASEYRESQDADCGLIETADPANSMPTLHHATRKQLPCAREKRRYSKAASSCTA
ncbi:NACHT, LRR and PYD domains-containing protein 3-like [Patiria miniata]|uniref:NACHT domain-containing protein n=1 Tax=Patiria miniata TaxID=46514 RepID=A0A914ARR4_PATMI|nr:NACHT, LRR and PYD domains-containing protein 3-like [Patiria miniata]